MWRSDWNHAPWLCTCVCRKERLLGFFRGVVPNALKVAPSSALTFLVYEEALKYMRAANNSNNNSKSDQR